MTDEDFNELAEELFQFFLERNPILATHMGLHQYDHLMPVGTRERMLKDVRLIKKFRNRFQELDARTLSKEKRLERNALLSSLNLWIYELDVLRFWESLPEGPFGVGSSLFPLFTRDFASLERRMESITSRLEKSPKYLTETRSRIIEPIKLWAEISVESCERLPSFLDVIEKTGKGALDKGAFEELEEGIAKTKEYLQDYNRWLKETILPKGKEECVIGERKFRKLLQLRELGLSMEEIYSLGKRYLKNTKRELKRLAQKIRPGASIEQVVELIKSKHPQDFEEALSLYRKSIKYARDFVVEKDLATLPADEELSVVETPSYLRHLIPYAAYLPPGKFDKKQLGIYMVTPAVDKPEMLKEHNYAGIGNTSVHEAYPGHHLQLVCSNQHPSLARALLQGTETVEGWAHYCEDLMKEKGFEDSLEARFMQTLDMVWRAARIVIDVDLHTKRMSYEEAIEFLINQTGSERPGAVAEVKRYTQHPAYQLSYLIGKHLIKELKKEVKRRMKSKYTDKFFNDTFLYAGSLPIRYMRQAFDNKLEDMGC